jgi:hypothetical protein
MLNVQQLPLATDIPEVMMLLLRLGTHLRAKMNTIQRTLEDSVSSKNLEINVILVEHPEMKPLRDYQDYTKFANEEFSNQKYEYFCKFIIVIRDNILTKSNGFNPSASF